MKEFALIFRLSKVADTKPSAQQIQQRMNWLASIAAQNKLADKGNTLSLSEAKTIKGENIVTDGPHTEIKEFISGYMVVRTATMEEAIELAKANPVLKVGGNVEVREVVKLYDDKLNT